MNKAFIIKWLCFIFIGIGLVFVAKKCFAYVCEIALFFEFLLGHIFYFVGLLYVLLAVIVFIACFDDL